MSTSQVLGDSPIVIGGAPGSGTRAYKNLAAVGGIEMLAAPLVVSRLRRRDPDVDHDNLLLRRFFYQRVIDHRFEHRVATPWHRRQLQLLLWATSPRAARRGRWGWKNPMTMHVLPMIADLFPDAFFLLVVRDGRDMAFGSRHELRERRHMLSAEEMSLPQHLQAAMYWERSNRRAVEEGRALFGDRFMVSKWEDLTADPEAEVEKLAAFWGIQGEAAELAAGAGIRPQTSSGRWRSAPRAEVLATEAIFGDLLTTLGYDLVGSDGESLAEDTPE